MSTTSSIIVKVRNSDKGKVMKFDETKVKVLDWGGQTCEDQCADVKIEKDYIGIYCHWDGYVEGVGKSLKKGFNTYDKALNLVLGGDCSAIHGEDIIHYANRNYESWNAINPTQGDSVEEVDGQIDSEYVYLFDEDKEDWVVGHRNCNFEEY